MTKDQSTFALHSIILLQETMDSCASDCNNYAPILSLEERLESLGPHTCRGILSFLSESDLARLSKMSASPEFIGSVAVEQLHRQVSTVQKMEIALGLERSPGVTRVCLLFV